MKLRILICESLNYLGGGPKLAIEIAAAIKDFHNVFFLIPQDGALQKIAREKNISCQYFRPLRLSKGKKSNIDVFKFCIYFPFVLTELFLTIARMKPDLIYINTAPYFITLTIIGYFLNTPVIWNVHNHFNDKRVAYLLRMFGRLGIVRRIICDSVALEEQFKGMREKTCTINPCINLSEFTRKYKTISDINCLDRVKKNLIVHIGVISPVKGQHILIEAVKYLCMLRKDVCFMLIGGNLKDDEAYKESLINLIKESKLEEVIKLAGFVDDFKPYLDVAFANVITSLEGFSIAMLEAAAFNVPSIVPDIGGPPTVIKDRYNGLIYRFKDHEDLSRKIIFALDNKNIYEKMRQNCRTFVEEFTTEKYHEKIRTSISYVLQI